MHALRAARILQVAAVFGAILSGCASTQQTSIDYKSRAVTRAEEGVRVSAAALSAEESAAVYGAPLATRRIQPVWIEVENREDRAYYLLSPGLDPNFFPASEAAEAVAQGDSERLAQLARPVFGLELPHPVAAGATA